MMEKQLVEKYIRTHGKLRKIVTYVSDDCELRREHEAIAGELKKNVHFSMFAKAYIPNRGIKVNAMTHLHNDIFLKFDIKDFFNSINHQTLVRQLYNELCQGDYIEFDDCWDIVNKCTCGMKGLPLGLVTSPLLANIFLKQFDAMLYAYLRDEWDFDRPLYSRYADDLVISFEYRDDYEKVAEEITEKVKELLGKFHLSLNEKKSQVINLHMSNHVRITGISVVKFNYEGRECRGLSVGKKLKNEMFWKAINIYDKEIKYSPYDVKRLKGLSSFIYSIEGKKMDYCYSSGMMELIKDRGYDSLFDLIKEIPEYDSHLSLEKKSKFRGEKELYLNNSYEGNIIQKVSKLNVGGNHTLEMNIVSKDGKHRLFDLRFWQGNKPLDGLSFSKKNFEKLLDDYKENGDIKEKIDFKDFFIHSDSRCCDHELESIIATIPICNNRGIGEITIDAEYCVDCGIYYISEANYRKAKESGILLCQLMSMTEYNNYKHNQKYGELNTESVLHMLGYNVDARKNLGKDERRNILRFAMDNDIVTREKAISHLKYLIHLNEKSPRLRFARMKWSEDLTWLRGGAQGKSKRFIGVKRIINFD